MMMVIQCPEANLNALTHMIALLQHSQALLELQATSACSEMVANEITLADASLMMQQVLEILPADCALEQAIQDLVGRHLALQLRRRKRPPVDNGPLVASAMEATSGEEPMRPFLVSPLPHESRRDERPHDMNWIIPPLAGRVQEGKLWTQI